MRIEVPHAWPRGEAEALALQDRLRPLADHRDPGPARPELVAGLDVAYAGDGRGTGDLVAAAVVVLDAGTFEVVEQATAVTRTTFPYIPGLFAFRELPALVEALRALRVTPDLMLCDGFGLAPRGGSGWPATSGCSPGCRRRGWARRRSPGRTTPGRWDRSAGRTPS
jgi:deoxyribonuclease V